MSRREDSNLFNNDDNDIRDEFSTTLGIRKNKQGDMENDEQDSIFETDINEDMTTTNNELTNNIDLNQSGVNNNLKFFPYSSNKLTRSTGTLNLSLSMINLTDMTDEGTKTNDLHNINEDDEPVEGFINRWSPFNEPDPMTPKLKRTASKSHLSPFINDADTLTKWKYMKPDIHTRRNLINKGQEGINERSLKPSLLPPNQVSSNKENFIFNEDRNPNIFGTQESQGLQSKLIRREEHLENKMKKSIIPNTPVKRNPLKDSTNLFSPLFQESFLSPNDRSRSYQYDPINNDDINSINNNLTFTKSPSIITPRLKLPSVISSPTSPSPQRSEGLLYSGNRHHQYSPQNQNKRFKKVKKSRESVIFKNTELTHSLQQFTDDLYGTDDDLDINEKKTLNHNRKSISKPHTESSLSFFHKFPPPIKLPNRAKNNISPVRTIDSDSNSSDDQCIATPTRRNMNKNKSRPNSYIKSHTQIIPPTIKIESPSKPNEENVPTKHERHINAAIKSRIISPQPPINPDTHLYEQFNNVQVIGQGQFSKVYQVTLPDTNNKYAVKSVNPNKHNPKGRIIQEISLLAEISETNSNDQDGKEYIIDFISSWKEMDTFYIMTNYYENGNLDKFLEDQIISKKKRLEDWRIWKIVVELCLALRFIHDSCHIVHLDIKPANIMITFEGNLKLADFGMATHLPLEDQSFENEGDREYIAPEIISDCIYDFRADIFSLGLMIVEIAANVILPDNGNAWHKLRSGDLSDAGRLSSSEIHSESLFSTASTKVGSKSNDISYYMDETNILQNNHMSSIDDHIMRLNNLNKLNPHRILPINESNDGSKIPAWVPKFLIDGRSLERMVKWMIEPDYRKRPTANQILATEECQYVEVTRKAGAVIQEDDFGPKPGFFD